MSTCPESVSGHDDPDRQGRCPFCRQKIGPKMPRPGLTYAEQVERLLDQNPLTIDGPTEEEYWDS